MKITYLYLICEMFLLMDPKKKFFKRSTLKITNNTSQSFNKLLDIAFEFNKEIEGLI